jgi:hypothetical protein
MMITAREASRIVEEVGGVGRQQSRRALRAGLAGRPEQAGRSLLFDREAVRALASWPSLDHESLLAECPGGVLVVRLGRGLEPGPSATWEEMRRVVRRQPYLGFPALLQVQAYLAVHGRLACVATVSDYPVLRADLVSFVATGDDQVELGLERPGSWADQVCGARLVTSPGLPWLLLGAQPCLGRAAPERGEGELAFSPRATTWARWA